MDITTLTVPNLVVNDLFMVKPMSSFTGYLTYMQYALGTPKGGVGGRDEDGNFKTVVQNETPFMFSPMSENREAYTSERVVEVATGAELILAWTPIVKGAFIDAEGNKCDVKIIKADGTIHYANADETGKVSGLTEGDRVAYKYDNVVIPQEKLPTMVGRMKGITLEAKARRIAVEYSQIAAYQAKTDYGLDFESTIAQQAQSEISYEIDAEAVYLIKNSADAAIDPEAGIKAIEWTDSNPDTVSYSMKAEGFARAIEAAKMEVYKRTQRLQPNWMLVSPDVMPILTFVPGFSAASNAVANGPYVAGNVAGMKVIVSPALGEKVCYLGVLGNDGKTAVGVFAPYMPIVPTQLLGFADGTMSQGFSTLYDMKILNDKLIQKIVINDKPNYLEVKVVEDSEI